MLTPMSATLTSYLATGSLMKKIIKNLKKINFKKLLSRRNLLYLSVFVLATLIVVACWSYFGPRSYSLGSADNLLTPISQSMAEKITYDDSKNAYSFNNGQSFESSETIQTGSSNVSALIYKKASKGLVVTDSVNNIDFSMSPKFSLKNGEQIDNRIIFPLINSDGWLVYTLQGTGIKEDIVLNSSLFDSMSFAYQLNIGDSLEARLESDGSIGIYGNTLLSSNISVSTEEDAVLLQKARQNAEKNTLIFSIPRPTVIQSDDSEFEVAAKFELNGKDLKIIVTGLKDASYPISIDPSIYVATAQQFMNGNNETNINFNVADQLIEKSRTTGARFDTWESTINLPTTSWGAGTVAAGGFIYSVGGTSFSGKIYNTQGSDTFTVPTGVTSITVKMWGAGAGGGGGGNGGAGAATNFVKMITPSNETITHTLGTNSTN